MTVNDNYEESYPANRVEDWLAKASAEQLKGWIAGGLHRCLSRCLLPGMVALCGCCRLSCQP